MVGTLVLLRIASTTIPYSCVITSPRAKKTTHVVESDRKSGGKDGDSFPSMQDLPRQDDSALCMAAIHILLQAEHCDISPYPWLESTMSLSLVSLPLCIECRAASRSHVRVARDTPRSLWAVTPEVAGNAHSNGRWSEPSSSLRPAMCPSSGALSPATTATGVPAVNVTKLTWERADADDELFVATKDLPSGVQELVFGDAFDQSVDAFAWPLDLKRLRFGAFFNQPIDGVSWPPELINLRFGRSFNQPIHDIVWPRKLERLDFGNCFNQVMPGSISSWPLTLVELTLGDGYNQPVNSVVWPPNLERLAFGREFNQAIDMVAWPRKLKELTLGWLFDQPLQGIALPESLEQLTLAGLFDYPLIGVILPAGLRKLTLGGHFNQTLESVRLPPLLEEITFGWSFNHSLVGVSWPLSLKRLTLGYRFKQPVDCIKLPTKLEALEFGVFSRQPLAEIVWPSSLRTLTVGRAFDLTGVVLPKNARICRRGHTYCKVQRGVKQWFYHNVAA